MVMVIARALTGAALTGCLLAGTGPAAATQTADPQPVEVAQVETMTPDGPQNWTVARIDLTRAQLDVTGGDDSGGSEFVGRTPTALLAARSQAVLAVNGGYFGVPMGNPVTPGGRPGLDAAGTVIAGGRRLSRPEPNQPLLNGTVCAQETAVILAEGQVCPGSTRWQTALTAGPMLLQGGAARTTWPADADAVFRQRHARTAIGLSADRQTAWLVVVDGRQSGSIGATLPEVTAFLQELGASDALNLDGGASSAMARRTPAGQITLVNRPVGSGTPGQERPVATHLLVVPRGS
jgi:exopolysaccharide biosynthesis protein